MAAEARVTDDRPCPHCGGTSFTDWDAPAPPLLTPIAMLHGPRYRLHCCLQCGALDWFLHIDALQTLRDQVARR